MLPRHSKLEMACLGSWGEKGGKSECAVCAGPCYLTVVPLQVQPSPPGCHGCVLSCKAMQPPGLPEAWPFHHYHRHDRGGRARIPDSL